MTPGRMEVGKQAVTWRTESPFAPVRDPREAQEHPIREGPQRCPAPRGPRCGWNPLADTGRQLIPGSSVSMGLRDSGKGTVQWQREAPAIPPAQECSRRGLFWCQQHRLGSQPSNFVLAAFSQKCPTVAAVPVILTLTNRHPVLTAQVHVSSVRVLAGTGTITC